MKYYGIIFSVLAVVALGACKKSEAPAAPSVSVPPIESPVRQVEIVTPKPIVEEKKKGTPRLDALEKRVYNIEKKITKYEQKYGQ